jgi:hypothetical protein
MLLERLHGAGLGEFDMLTLTDDTTRQGALRFCDSDGCVITGNTAPVPRLIDLEDLRSIAATIERRGEVTNTALRQMAGAGGSIGGARPKANILDDDQLRIAKFSSATDTSPVERIEVATLQLARLVGLNAPEANLILETTDSPIALIRRFDRDGPARIFSLQERCYSKSGFGDVAFGSIIFWNVFRDCYAIDRQVLGIVCISNGIDNVIRSEESGCEHFFHRSSCESRANDQQVYIVVDRCTERKICGLN